MATTAEFLRKLADLIDLASQLSQGTPSEPEKDEPVDDNTGVMVPPLQQKIELMKKIAGVESVYDEETPDEKQDESTSNEDLETIKRNAGLAAALSDDEPVDE